MRRILTIVVCFLCLSFVAYAQDGHQHDDHAGHDHAQHNHADHNHDHADHAQDGEHHAHTICGHDVSHEFDAGGNAIHHIADANVYSIGPFMIPLPAILYVPGEGWEVFLSNKFKNDFMGHGDGHQAYNRFVLDGGTIKRVADERFPKGEVPVAGFVHTDEGDFVCADNNLYPLDKKSTADGGIFGGGITSFYDFSLTKNVTTMMIVFFLLFLVFRAVASAYTRREGQAPTGLQNFIETFIVFIRDEVAKPFLGHKYPKFLPFLLCIFFFILALNLFGQIPFLGGSNVTGNLSVTAALAIIAFIVTSINGNSHYWKHILLASGTPIFVKPILIPVEILGLFIKPLTLMLRLFANITAGHMVILIFVSFIFIFGRSGESIAGASGGVVGATILTLFMMTIELIVAFVQAFVFTILTASYIGAATEEEHH